MYSQKVLSLMANNYMMGVAQLKKERTMTDTYRIRGENTSLGHQHITVSIRKMRDISSHIRIPPRPTLLTQANASA